VTQPTAPFSAIDVPQTGSVIKPGQSITVNITFAPTAAGASGSALTIDSDGGKVDVALTGTAAAGGQLQVAPIKIDFGTVPVGQTVSKSFTVKNGGGIPLTITKSKPPSLAVGFTATTALAEQTSIKPGEQLTETVAFKSPSGKPATDTWVLNSDPGSGLQTVTFDANGATAGGVQGVTPAGLFVGHLYSDILGRTGDPAGLQFWSDAIAAGASHAAVATVLAGSHEAHEHLVAAAYQSLLHRAADPAGLAAYTGLLDSGATPLQVEASLAGSPENFTRAGGNANAYVTALYSDFVHRTPDTGGLAYYSGLLKGGAPLWQIAASIGGSAERDQRAVAAYYLAYLRRSPDPGGLATYVSLMQAGVRNEQIIGLLTGSDEYYSYAQTH
jgi:hypothetical protein